MLKYEFLARLQRELSGLPREEREERLAFYNEMIEDRIEEGLSEEEAVAAVGGVVEIVKQVIADVPFVKIAKERIKPKRRLSVWEIVLLVLGSPIWLSLLVSVFAVSISLYASLWAVVISLWAAFLSVAVCAPACIALGVITLPGYGMTGLAAIGTGFILAGIAILLCMGCKAATRGAALLAKKAVHGIKLMLLKKEAVE